MWPLKASPMPIETIKCQECGSADVTEFKSGTYVCGHCESVFKYTKTEEGHAGPVACETCGVLAVGRCRDCARPFCADHQAKNSQTADTWRGEWKYVSTPISRLCVDCQLAMYRTKPPRSDLPQPGEECAGCRDTTRTRAVCDGCKSVFCWRCLNRYGERIRCPKCANQMDGK